MRQVLGPLYKFLLDLAGCKASVRDPFCFMCWNVGVRGDVGLALFTFQFSFSFFSRALPAMLWVGKQAPAALCVSGKGTACRVGAGHSTLHNQLHFALCSLTIAPPL